MREPAWTLTLTSIPVGRKIPVELIVGAAVGAAVASPSVRKVFRRGLIYGLGGALIAYDKVAELTQKAVKGARKGVQSAVDAESPSEPAPASPPATSETPATTPQDHASAAITV